MQPDKSISLQAMAIQLISEKEQETMRLLMLVQSQNETLLLQYQHQQAVLAQQQRTISQLKAELQAYRSRQQLAFGLVHAN